MSLQPPNTQPTYAANNGYQIQSPVSHATISAADSARAIENAAKQGNTAVVNTEVNKFLDQFSGDDRKTQSAALQKQVTDDFAADTAADPDLNTQADTQALNLIQTALSSPSVYDRKIDLPDSGDHG